MGCGVVEWLVVWQCQQKNHLLAHRYWVLTLNNNVLCLFVNLRQQLTLTTRQTTTTMMRRTTNLRQATKQVWTTKKHFLFQAKQLTLRIYSINKIYNHLVNYQGQCDQIGLFCLQISHQSIPKNYGIWWLLWKTAHFM